MAIIVAHWDIPQILTGKQSKKLFSRWSHTAKAFGLKDLRFIDSEKEPMPIFGDTEINLSTYRSLDEALDGLDNIVYVEQGGQDINDFKFPDDPTFVFGSDYGELPEAGVSIVTDIPLHADVAMGIVLSKWRG